jgi:hypothetical protein
MHVIYKGNADLNFEGSLEEPSTKEKQKCRAPMVLPEQEGLELLLRRIESLLERQQKDLGPQQASVREDNGKEKDAKDNTVMVSQQELRRVRRQC